MVEDARPEQIFLSAVTIGELLAGVELRRKNNAAKAVEIENWLSQVEESFAVVPMDSSCFRESARLKTADSCHLIEDATITPTAKVHGLHLATRNVLPRTRGKVDMHRISVPELRIYAATAA